MSAESSWWTPSQTANQTERGDGLTAWQFLRSWILDLQQAWVDQMYAGTE